MLNIPECAHNGDIKWIEEMLSKLNPTMRQKAVEGYTSVFTSELSNEPIEHKKLNRARYSANLRLRLFVDRFHLALNGYTVNPPEVK